MEWKYDRPEEREREKMKEGEQNKKKKLKLKLGPEMRIKNDNLSPQQIIKFIDQWERSIYHSSIVEKSKGKEG